MPHCGATGTWAAYGWDLRRWAGVQSPAARVNAPWCLRIRALARVFERKRAAGLDVADPAMFVGRRREVQRALSILADGKHAGILFPGMGRLGKTSLAARIADRGSDLRLAIVFGTYDARSVIDELTEALRDHEPARRLLVARRSAALKDTQAFEDLPVDLLNDLSFVRYFVHLIHVGREAAL